MFKATTFAPRERLSFSGEVGQNQPAYAEEAILSHERNTFKSAEHLSQVATLHGVAYKSFDMGRTKWLRTFNATGLIIDFGNWGQMCKDLMIAILEYYGYIIPT